MFAKFKPRFIFVCAALVMSQTVFADALKELSAFPAAEAGKTRQVIVLPELENEYDAKVELIIGKEIEVDCNRHFFGGNIEEKDLQGWGYSYWVLDELKGPMGTLMACPDSATKTKSFVSMNTSGLLRYNSKLPIVVYVPEGVEVKYRIWQAGVEVNKAEVK
ncbi:MAG: serine protease inhibitor ecotin [Saezia sp.]